jgi:hypothetical protein
MSLPVSPLRLPLVPPMDRNRSMPGIDRISPVPLELRTRQGVGLFGTRRGEPAGLIRMHEGIDLLAPIGEPVFAAASGTVVNAGGSVLILHEHGFRYLTFYQHLQNVVVAAGDPVTAGQRIAEVGDFAGSREDHLHFEVRYLFDGGGTSRADSMPVDPTMALYEWEERSYQNDEAARRGHVIDRVPIVSLEEVRRARLLRFVLVNVQGDARDLFIPLHDPSPFTEGMIASLKQAFAAGRDVRIVWRDSLFFRNIQSTHPFASVIAEVKVYR